MKIPRGLLKSDKAEEKKDKTFGKTKKSALKAMMSGKKGVE